MFAKLGFVLTSKSTDADCCEGYELPCTFRCTRYHHFQSDSLPRITSVSESMCEQSGVCDMEVLTYMMCLLLCYLNNFSVY